MNIRSYTGLAAALGLLAFGACDELPTREGRTGQVTKATSSTTTTTCQPTGTGLTAKVVNQDVVGATIDVGDCDVGAFFDQDGTVRGATFLQDDDDGAPRVQYGVLVRGADVDVTRSEVDVVEDFAHQFIAVGYRDGATGLVSGNTITGFHRAGILLDGADTAAEVRRNEVVGVGPKTTGWAENGIQVSRGATGTVKRNTVEDHWWDENSFLSSGIIVFDSDDVLVQRNALAGNDAALSLSGSRNNLIHNTVDVTDADGASSGIFHAGAVVFGGVNNGLRHNAFTSGSPAGSASFGVFVTAAAENTKLIGNRFRGFGTAIVDQGDETKLPDPFDPSAP